MKVVVMGVSGCGKSRIGTDLAAALGGRFIDGDDLHPVENRAKMTAGIPLTDADRAPWLDCVGDTLATTPGIVVVACSALKRAYRDRIRERATAVQFLHLTGPRAVIAARMAARADHFMPTSLLNSQFATLEPLTPDEPHLALDLTLPPHDIIAQAAAWLLGDRA